jgi:hypothetical protein
VIKILAHIEECLWGASPACAEAFNGKMSCAASGDPRDQEHNAMMETAQHLHEQYTQIGAPSLALMDRIRERMMPMNFKVTNKEAAGFATEAHTHHMCTVASLSNQGMLLRGTGEMGESGAFPATTQGSQ